MVCYYTERYDVMLEPENLKEDDAIILEFKVINPRKENSLENAMQAALVQIEEGCLIIS